ncbi:GNAT family N-acetyltransferase [Halobacillus ihumii]|uniref:GNAT family N-acetyltransferase n=1 Tax=Halobacillus ihumii TaxID=2686092 RepID=UPI0023DD94F2|nr:GNAT family N-acetyltransferase [Halobacillus ihumii]
MKQSNYSNIKELYQNKKVREFLGGVRKEDSIHEILNEMLKSDDGSWYWIIKDKKLNGFIGLVSLTPHHNGEDIEVSYQLLPKWWRNGYATEVVSEVMNFAFEKLKVRSVVAETQTANLASRKLLEKLEMQLVNTFRRFGAEQSFYTLDRDS